MSASTRSPSPLNRGRSRISALNRSRSLLVAVAVLEVLPVRARVVYCVCVACDWERDCCVCLLMLGEYEMLLCAPAWRRGVGENVSRVGVVRESVGDGEEGDGEGESGHPEEASELAEGIDGNEVADEVDTTLERRSDAEVAADHEGILAMLPLPRLPASLPTEPASASSRSPRPPLAGTSSASRAATSESRFRPRAGEGVAYMVIGRRRGVLPAEAGSGMVERCVCVTMGDEESVFAEMAIQHRVARHEREHARLRPPLRAGTPTHPPCSAARLRSGFAR